MAKYTVTRQSPFGRPGDVVEVDSNDSRVKVYVKTHTLVPYREDDVSRETSEGEELRVAQEGEVETVNTPTTYTSAELQEKDRTATLDEFDPAEHSVAEVKEYLTDRPDEFERIIEAEKSGKKREGILSLTPDRFEQQD